MIVVARTQAEHDKLYDLDLEFEFEVFDGFGPAYKMDLVRRCQDYGFSLANMASPTDILELWLRCREAETFLKVYS